MADSNLYQAQANELSQKLWAIANELRGQMDASEFKNYILGVIFYRYLVDCQVKLTHFFVESCPTLAADKVGVLRWVNSICQS